MELGKQVPNRRGIMPQQHAWVGLHRLATLRLRWTTNNEAYCEWVPVDLLQRWHLRTTSSTGCGLQLAAETKLEIMKSKQQQLPPTYGVPCVVKWKMVNCQPCALLIMGRSANPTILLTRPFPQVCYLDQQKSTWWCPNITILCSKELFLPIFYRPPEETADSDIGPDGQLTYDVDHLLLLAAPT